MLKFNTNTWHYKAFKFWHEVIKGKNYAPCTTNLCSYTHAVFFGCMFFVVGGSVFSLAVVIYCLLWPFLASAGVITGWKPYALDPTTWKPYKPFLTLFGNPIHIAQIVVPLATVCFAMFIVSVDAALTDIEQIALFLFRMIVPVFLAWIFYKCSLFSIAEYEKINCVVQKNIHKEPNLFFEMLKAKKQKICPLVEFNENN